MKGLKSSLPSTHLYLRQGAKATLLRRKHRRKGQGGEINLLEVSRECQLIFQKRYHYICFHGSRDSMVPGQKGVLETPFLLPTQGRSIQFLACGVGRNLVSPRLTSSVSSSLPSSTIHPHVISLKSLGPCLLSLNALLVSFKV